MTTLMILKRSHAQKILTFKKHNTVIQDFFFFLLTFTIILKFTYYFRHNLHFIACLIIVASYRPDDSKKNLHIITLLLT